MPQQVSPGRRSPSCRNCFLPAQSVIIILFSVLLIQVSPVVSGGGGGGGVNDAGYRPPVRHHRRHQPPPQHNNYHAQRQQQQQQQRDYHEAHDSDGLDTAASFTAAEYGAPPLSTAYDSHGNIVTTYGGELMKCISCFLFTLFFPSSAKEWNEDIVFITEPTP